MKNKKVIVIIVFSLILLALLMFLSTKTDKRIKNYVKQEVSYSKEKYQKIFDSYGDKSVINGFNINGKDYKIGVYVENIKEPNSSLYENNYNIFVDEDVIEKDIYCGAKCLGNVYLIEDVIYYEIIASDGNVVAYFKNLEGKTLKKVKYFNKDKKLGICTGCNAKVEDNKVTFEAKYGGQIFQSYVTNSALEDDRIVYGIYEIDYLGSGKFSKIKTISSKTKKEYNDYIENK